MKGSDKNSEVRLWTTDVGPCLALKSYRSPIMCFGACLFRIRGNEVIVKSPIMCFDFGALKRKEGFTTLPSDLELRALIEELFSFFFLSGGLLLGGTPYIHEGPTLQTIPRPELSTRIVQRWGQHQTVGQISTSNTSCKAL